MIFSLTLVLVLSNIIFFLGFFSLIFAIRSSFYIILSIETMVIAININFLFYLNSSFFYLYYIIYRTKFLVLLEYKLIFNTNKLFILNYVNDILI